MDSFQFIDIILLAMVAGFLVLRLRSNLGRRTGHEQGPKTFSSEKVVSINKNDESQTYEHEDEKHHSKNGIDRGISEIINFDPSFNIDEFKSGALKAFEIILYAFSRKDTDTLDSLLSKDVFNAFMTSINEREEACEVLETKIIKVEISKINSIGVKGSLASITLEFISEQVNLINSQDGKLIEGDPDQIESYKDQWTFHKSLNDKDPNWELASTKSLG